MLTVVFDNRESETVQAGLKLELCSCKMALGETERFPLALNTTIEKV